MMQRDQSGYRTALGLATLIDAVHLADDEPDDERRHRKHLVVQEKWALLRETFPDDLRDLRGYGGTGPAVRQLTGVLADLTRQWPPARRWLLLIDLLLGDAFAPYQFRVDVDGVRTAVTHVAASLGLSGEEIASLFTAWNAAVRVHHPAPRFRLLRSAPDAAVAVPAVTADPGLSGAGDTSTLQRHTRALLAGGSLSGHDPAFAGGLWLLTPAARGEPTNDQPSILDLSSAHVRVELVKLHMSVDLVVRRGMLDDVDTDGVVAALAACDDALDRRLELERRRNDDEAERVRSLEARRRAVRTARAAVDAADQHPIAA